MDDGYTHQFVRDDAEHTVKRAEGCGECPDITACKAGGACIRTLKPADETTNPES